MKFRKKIILKLCQVLVCALIGYFNISCSRQVVTVHREVSFQDSLDYYEALTEATRQKLYGNYNDAGKLLVECIKVNPYGGAAKFELSELYVNKNDFKNALKYAKEAYESDENNKWYGLNLAKLYQYSGNADSLIILYKNLIKNDEENIDLKYQLGNVFASKSDFKSAIVILNNIYENYGVIEQVNIAREQVYLHLKKVDDAEQCLKELIDKNPGYPPYLGLIAEFYDDHNKVELAQMAYNKLFEIDSLNSNGQLSYAEFLRHRNRYNEAFAVLRQAMLNKNTDLEKKLNILLSYITSDREFKDYNDKLSDFIQILKENSNDDIRVKSIYADFLIRNKEFKKSENELKEILDLRKDNPAVWEQILYVQNILGEYKEMDQFSDEAIKYFPKRANLYFFRGLALNQAKRFKESIGILDSGLRYTNNDKGLLIQFYTFLGESYNGLKMFSESDACFDKVLALDNKNLLVLNNYSYYLSERGVNLDKAKKLSQVTIKLEPENANYLDTYGWILYRNNEINEAKKYIEKAIQYSGAANYEIISHYAEIMLKLGDKASALKYFEISKKLGNKSDAIIKKIDLLKNYKN
jgi:predicted Zn-dependent protease